MGKIQNVLLLSIGYLMGANMSLIYSFRTRLKSKQLVRKAKRHGSIIEKPVLLKNTVLDGANIVRTHVSLLNCHLGLGTNINNHCSFSNTLFGKFTSVGSCCSSVVGTHPTKMVSTFLGFTHPECVPEAARFCNFPSALFEERKNGYYVEIGNDVWIGQGVLIKGGISIGDGAVVGMGAVVTEDIPPYAVVGGVPAKIIHYRFDEKTIKGLLEIKWWDWPLEKIRDNAILFDDPKKLLAKFLPNQ